MNVEYDYSAYNAPLTDEAWEQARIDAEHKMPDNCTKVVGVELKIMTIQEIHDNFDVSESSVKGGMYYMDLGWAINSKGAIVGRFKAVYKLKPHDRND